MTLLYSFSSSAIYPGTASNYNLGTNSLNWKTVYYCNLTDKTCAYFGDYSIEKLYEMFSGIKAYPDSYHICADRTKMFPHIDFSTLPDEFSYIATETHTIPLAKLKGNEIIYEDKEFKEGEKAGIETNTMLEALSSFVVKQYEEIQELKKRIEALKK